jgi:exosortase
LANTLDNPRAPAVTAATRSTASLLVYGVGALGAVFAYRGILGIGESPSDLEGPEAWVFDPAGSSPILIFAATGWLLARRWDRIQRAIGAPPRPIAGLAAIAVAAALCVWSYYTGARNLLVPSFSLLMVGSALWLGGTVALRTVLLPALFVLIAMPIPIALVNHFVYPLQLLTAEVVTGILRLVGLDLHSQADLIYYRGVTFQVIESCSGLRTISTILMSAFLYQDLFYRSRLQSTLLVIASPLVGLVANNLRVMMIVLNPYSSFAAVHTAQGLVMIVVAVLMLAAVDAVLTRLLSPGQPTRRIQPHPAPSLVRVFALSAGIAAMAATSLLLAPWKAPVGIGPPLGTLPAQLGAFKAAGMKLDHEFLGSIGFSEWVHRRYETGAEPVELLLGSDHRTHEYSNFLSDKTAVPARGWKIVERGAVRIGDRDMERFVFESSGEQQLAYRWITGVGPWWAEALRAVLALDRGPLRRPGRAMVFRISTRFGPGQRSAAEDRLQTFLSLADPSLTKLTEVPTS